MRAGRPQARDKMRSMDWRRPLRNRRITDSLRACALTRNPRTTDSLRACALPRLIFLATALAVSSWAADKSPAQVPAQVQAVVLDHNQFLCTNCLFGISDYYFCFEANDKILIGHDKVRTQTWQKDPVELAERGKTVAIRFDDRFIWVPRPKGKDLKLTQDYTKKIFLSSDKCQAAIKSPSPPQADQ